MDIIWLVIGLVLVVKGADVMINALTDLGRRLNVPSFVLGLIAVSVGTSAPETAIGVISGIERVNKVTLGTVIGSNTVNILIVIAITAIAQTLPLSSEVTRRTIPLMVMIESALVAMLWTGGILSRIEALLLLGGAILFTAYTVSSTRQAARNEVPDTPFEGAVFEYLRDEAALAEEERAASGFKASIAWPILLFLVSLGAVAGGAQLALNGAVGIARGLDISEAFIGLTIVAFGTSLPELVTSLTAVRKQEYDIAVGNIFGSNIYNTLLVLGLSGTLNPIPTDRGTLADALFMLLAAVLIWLAAIFRKRLSRLTGILYLLIYLSYMSAKIAFGF